METKPIIEAALVQQFVGNAHGDLDRIKELLTQEPALITSAGIGEAETLKPALAPPPTWDGGISPNS
jgi:hypothetical protein